MSDDRQAPRDYILIISLLALLIFLTQYTFRYLDDNRLTSWQWVFNGVPVERVFLYLAGGILTAYILSISPFLKRGPLLSLLFISYIVPVFLITEPEVIVDTSRYFTQAKYLELKGTGYFLKEWGGEIHAWTDMPLIPFLYGLIFRYIGETRLHIQLFTTLLFSFTVVLTYLIGRDLWDKETGVYGGLFLLGMPYLLTQVPLMLVDVPTTFFLTLSVFTYIRALRYGRAWIVLSSGAIVSAIFSKYSTPLMLTILPVISFVFFMERKEYREHLKSSILKHSVMVYLVSGIVMGLIILIRFDVIRNQIYLLLNYQKPALKGWSESLLSTFLYQIHPFITISAISSIYVALKRRDIRYVIILWLALLIFFMGIRRIRYTLVIFPMYALMASYGLRVLREERIKRFFSYTTVVFTVVLVISVYLPFLKRMAPVNFKDAGDFLNSEHIKSIRVITPPSKKERVLNQAITVSLLDLYFKGDIYYKQDGAVLSFERFRMSPLRFTWEYRVPEYYSFERRAEALVIIFNTPLPALPETLIEDFHRSVEFHKSTGFFRYSPSVRIYY